MIKPSSFQYNHPYIYYIMMHIIHIDWPSKITIQPETVIVSSHVLYNYPRLLYIS